MKLPKIKVLLEARPQTYEQEPFVLPSDMERAAQAEIDDMTTDVPQSQTGPAVRHDIFLDTLSFRKAQQLIVQFKDNLAAVGINTGSNPRIIGKGRMGHAFDIGDKILKLTTDRNEANACKRIMGQKLKNVYEIFDVYELDSYHVFAIHEEKMKPLDKDIFNWWQMPQGALAEWKKHKDDEKALKYFNDRWEFRGTDDPGVYDKLKEAFLQALNGLKELEKNSIDFRDFHKKNVMAKPGSGELALIDLGASKSPQKKIDKLGEAELKELFRHQMSRISP